MKLVRSLRPPIPNEVPVEAAQALRAPVQQEQGEAPGITNSLSQVLGNNLTGAAGGGGPDFPVPGNQALGQLLGGAGSPEPAAPEVSGGEARPLREAETGGVPEEREAVGGEARPLQDTVTGGGARNPVREALAQASGGGAAPPQQPRMWGPLRQVLSFGRRMFDRARGFVGGLFNR